MFDNGNFRRKRKRKSDGLAGEGTSGGTLSSEAGDGNRSPENATLDISATSEKAPTMGPTPCLSNFLTEMSGVSTGSVEVGGEPINRPIPLSLSVDGSQRATQTSGFSTFSSGSTVPEWASPLPPPPPISPSGSHSILGYSSPAINQFSGHFYPGLNSTGILYPREGTEV